MNVSCCGFISVHVLTSADLQKGGGGGLFVVVIVELRVNTGKGGEAGPKSCRSEDVKFQSMIDKCIAARTCARASLSTNQQYTLKTQQISQQIVSP